MKPVRLLLADDHQIFRDGLAGLLEKQADLTVIGEAADGREAVTLSQKLNPDVVLMDLNMHELNGVDATRAILNDNPNIKIIGLSMREDDQVVVDMLRAGAKGYVPKE